MTGTGLRIQTTLMPDAGKPPVAAVAAAIGRAPSLSDLDTMPPPLGAMLPYPPEPSLARQCERAARDALGAGGTVVVFNAPADAAAAERWLRSVAEDFNGGR